MRDIVKSASHIKLDEEAAVAIHQGPPNKIPQLREVLRSAAFTWIRTLCAM